MYSSHSMIFVSNNSKRLIDTIPLFLAEGLQRFMRFNLQNLLRALEENTVQEYKAHNTFQRRLRKMKSFPWSNRRLVASCEPHSWVFESKEMQVWEQTTFFLAQKPPKPPWNLLRGANFANPLTIWSLHLQMKLYPTKIWIFY